MLGRSAEFFKYSPNHASPQNGRIHFTVTSLSLNLWLRVGVYENEKSINIRKSMKIESP